MTASPSPEPAAPAGRPFDRAELAAWLRLLQTPGLGRDGARRLLSAFGSAEAVFEADPAAHGALLTPALAAALSRPPDGLEALLDLTEGWLAAAAPDAPRSLVSLGDADYPDALLHTPDPPLLLHALGQRALLATPMMAIVGSRQTTPQGREVARMLASGLASAGWTVVSGLALGIDGAAHEAALDAGGPSIAVVGTGLDRVYPARHRDLAHRLATQGLLLSEFNIGTPPLAGHFPMRNRIIAGLARGTVVVEAALKSGSLITARLAAECGREVFAVPGSILSPQSRGCHLLIKQGAKLVESVEDVLEEFDPARASRPRISMIAAGEASAGNESGAPLDEDEADLEPPDGSAHPRDPRLDPVLEALGHDPVTLDDLLARTGWPLPVLGATLLDLELAGRVARLPGQRFQRIGLA